MIRKKPALGLDPRVGTGFPKRSCSNKKIERDDDSKKSHPALGKASNTARGHKIGLILADMLIAIEFNIWVAVGYVLFGQK
jgi:hypothetical protein